MTGGNARFSLANGQTPDPSSMIMDAVENIGMRSEFLERWLSRSGETDFRGRWRQQLPETPATREATIEAGKLTVRWYACGSTH